MYKTVRLELVVNKINGAACMIIENILRVILIWNQSNGDLSHHWVYGWYEGIGSAVTLDTHSIACQATLIDENSASAW